MAKSLEKDVVTLPLNNIEVCNDLIDEHRDDLAAVLLDPLPAALGLIPPNPEFVSALRARTRECGALLIADEVLSFRIDYRGACHLLGVEPDLVALGKIIGGGFPVGAVAGKAEVMSVFDHRGARPGDLNRRTQSRHGTVRPARTPRYSSISCRLDPAPSAAIRKTRALSPSRSSPPTTPISSKGG